MANQSDLKRVNQTRILQTVRADGALSRAAIADRLGLDRKSVSNLVAELLAGRWLRETGVAAVSRGRPGILLELDGSSHLSLGVHIAENRVTGVLTNMLGVVSGRSEAAFAFDPGLPELTAALGRVYDELVALGGDQLSCLGFSVPGILDCQSGEVIRSVNIPVLNGQSPAALLQGGRRARRLPADVLLEESSRARTLAEQWFGMAQNRSDFIFLDLGIGIGAGIILDRKLRGGPYAGEIGHLVIRPGGRRCACGNCGCLEAYISEKILCEEIGRASGQRLSALAELEAPGAAAVPILAEAGYCLGLGLAALINLLCPPLVVIGGGLTRFAEIIFPAMERGLAEAALPASLRRVEVLISRFGSDAAALGAAAAAYRRHFEA